MLGDAVCWWEARDPSGTRRVPRALSTRKGEMRAGRRVRRVAPEAESRDSRAESVYRMTVPMRLQRMSVMKGSGRSLSSAFHE
jgi:hypothetical protein